MLVDWISGITQPTLTAVHFKCSIFCMFWVFIVSHGVWGVILGNPYGWCDDYMYSWGGLSWDTLKWWLSERGGGFHQALWCTVSLPASSLALSLSPSTLPLLLLQQWTVGVSVGGAPRWPWRLVGFIQCIFFRNTIFWVSLCFFTLSVMLNRDEPINHIIPLPLVNFHELAVHKLGVRECQKATVCLSTGTISH